jgi:hopanoid biosynthesis associated protein HpnK
VNVRRLIVNADDMGLTEGHNRAIIHAHAEGILTSASLLANGTAFADAVVRAREQPRLGIGVHLTLLEGTPVRPVAAVPGMVRDGLFGVRYGALLWNITLRRIELTQAYDEWQAQIEKVMSTGLPITHLDSHKHVHMHPQLLGLALALAEEYGIGRMRLSRPPGLPRALKPALLGVLAIWARRRMARRGIRFPNALLGIEHSGTMTTMCVLAAVQDPWHGIRELMMHPACLTPQVRAALSDRGYDWVARYRFRDELAALCSPHVRSALSKHGVQLVSYEAL